MDGDIEEEAREPRPLTSRPRSTASIAGHPLYPMLSPFPIAFFVAAFVTDWLYMHSGILQWQYFSIWLITAGLIIGGLSVLALLVDFFGDRSVRAIRPAGWHLGVVIVIMLLELLNAFVHSRDGWVAVVPQGILLSGICVLLLIVSGILGSSLTYRHGLGVRA